MDHAFKGSRFPWTLERMAFILQELITKQRKYKRYQKLVEVYIILAEKIGATPRIVENFLKNLGRDYREMLKVNPEIDCDVVKLRGSNEIFKLFVEYSKLYLNEDATNISFTKMNEYIMESGVLPLTDEDDDDASPVEESLASDVKHEGKQPESSCLSSSVQRGISSPPGGLQSPPPPPAPRPRPPKSQGRRSIGFTLLKHPGPGASSTQQDSLNGYQASLSPDMCHIAHPSDLPMTSQPHPQAPYPSIVPNSIVSHAHQPPSHVSSADMFSHMLSLPQPTFHQSIPTVAVASNPHQFIPLQVIQSGGGTAPVYTTQQAQQTTSPASTEPQNTSYPAAAPSNKRPKPSQQDTPSHPSKKSRTNSVPLVSENLPSEMTEFERRYLQSLDTQNKMLSDISRELKLLRTGFFAIHSDDIADLVNPNMH